MLLKKNELQAQIIIGEGVKTKSIIYDLTVSRVDQSPLLEFRPVAVRFKLIISIGGKGGTDPTPQPVRICAKVPTTETTCFTIDAPVFGQVYTGKVKAMTSFAGQNSPIRLVVLGAPNKGEDYGGVSLSEGEVFAPVATRYDIAITGFDVVTSRSNQTDTQWFVLQGMVNSDPPHSSADPEAANLVGFHWFQGPRRYGDAGDGKHIVNDIRVGSYDL